MSWTQAEAIALCRKIETIAPASGCHVALTGGTLYKDGPRKDADILFYRIRQVTEIDMDVLEAGLTSLGVVMRDGNRSGWVIKADYRRPGQLRSEPLDLFFPDFDGEYSSGAPAGDSAGDWLEPADSDRMSCGCIGGGHEPDCRQNPIFASDPFLEGIMRR